MRVYRVFAFLIALEVVVQAAAIAFAMFGFGHWIENGGVADKSTFEEGNLNFSGGFGFTFHGVNGSLYIPVLALAFLVVSFFVKSVSGGVKWAAIVFGLVVLQVALGFLSLAVFGLGPLHAINAFALFMVALHAGRRATTPRVVRPEAERTAV